MITKEEIQKYISVVEEVPDKCGEMPDGRYNTRYVGKYGEYMFAYLPGEVAKALQKEVKEANDDPGGCHSISGIHHDNEAFICSLEEGHEGLCVASSRDNTIVAIFDPVGDSKAALLYLINRKLDNLIEKLEDACEDD